MKTIITAIIITLLSILCWNTASVEVKEDLLSVYERTTINVDGVRFSVEVTDKDVYEVGKMDNNQLCQLLGFEKTINEPTYDVEMLQEEVQYRFGGMASQNPPSYKMCEYAMAQGATYAVFENTKGSF